MRQANAVSKTRGLTLCVSKSLLHCAAISPVVPVLVRGAGGCPRVDQLPDDLKELAYRNAVELAPRSIFIRRRGPLPLMQAFEHAFRSVPHTICYSVKANSTLAILRLIARFGAGFDVVSGGGLERVLRARSRAAGKVVFSGVGKTVAEISDTSMHSTGSVGLCCIHGHGAGKGEAVALAGTGGDVREQDVDQRTGDGAVR